MCVENSFLFSVWQPEHIRLHICQNIKSSQLINMYIKCVLFSFYVLIWQWHQWQHHQLWWYWVLNDGWFMFKYLPIVCRSAYVFVDFFPCLTAALSLSHSLYIVFNYHPTFATIKNYCIWKLSVTEFLFKSMNIQWNATISKSKSHIHTCK